MFIKVREFGVAPHALMFDPQLYIFDFDYTSKLTRFLVVEEQHLDLAPFIDIRFEPMAKCSFAVPTAELIVLDNQHGMERPRSSFIFHHAFVCSTLLARCLSQTRAFFSLKEPWILRRLADIKRHSGMKIPDHEWKRLFSKHLALLAKNYRSGTSPVIKATNVANNLIGDVLRFLPEHKSLYLYSDLESFLVSNLKKPVETQQKLPGLARSFIGDEDFALRFPQYCEIAQLSFLQVCALVWVTSLYNFCVNVDRFPNRNVRTLDMDVFLERPADAVSALSKFFDHHPDSGELAAMVGPGVMNRDAKHPGQAYGREVRRVEAEQVIASNRHEIDRVLAWARPLEQELALLTRMKSRQLLQG